MNFNVSFEENDKSFDVNFQNGSNSFNMNFDNAVFIGNDDAVKSINGILPDEDGNVALDIPECKVKSVNGIEPDENGNVEISIPEVDTSDFVKTVNGEVPDENGNVEIETTPDELEQIALLVELDMLPAIHDASGAILTDENGNIILRY